MVAFMAKDRKTVEATYETALRNGGISEGLPGLRPEYHANYFGAYFRDPEGNKVCVASHGSPPARLSEGSGDQHRSCSRA